MEAYAATTTLVLLDIPAQTTLTLDTLSFTSTPSFRGIKFIGPGVHLLTYGLDKSDLGMRNGIFFLGTPGIISAWQWDKSTELLTRIQEQVQGAALQERNPINYGLTSGIASLHPYLTTLPPLEEDVTTTWADLTSYITADLLNRVLPPGWTFSSQTPSTNDDATDQLSTLPSSKSEAILNFTTINLKRTFNPSAIGAERTSQILDKSYYLESILQSLPDELQLLGELQTSFLTVLYMNNFSGFETWKKLFSIFCGCKMALQTHERLFRRFLTVIRAEFDICSEETFNDVILEGNFVADNLRVFPAVTINIELEYRY
jgi:A1 cistron-splicing factor AAR2